MSASYFLWLDDRIQGPYTYGKLDELLRRGKISADTQIWHSDMPRWEALKAVIPCPPNSRVSLDENGYRIDNSANLRPIPKQKEDRKYTWSDEFIETHLKVEKPQPASSIPRPALPQGPSPAVIAAANGYAPSQTSEHSSSDISIWSVLKVITACFFGFLLIYAQSIKDRPPSSNPYKERYDSAMAKINSGRPDLITNKEAQTLDDVLNYCDVCKKPLRSCEHSWQLKR